MPPLWPQKRQQAQLSPYLQDLLSNPYSRSAIGYAMPWLMNMVQSSQIPKKVAGAVPGMLNDAYKSGTRLATKPINEPFDHRDAKDLVDFTGGAGMLSVAAPARAAALGARTRPASLFSGIQDLPAAEPRTAPKGAFRKHPTGTYYHGTNDDFAKYDPDRSSDGAMFLSPDKYFAEGFGNIVKEADILPGKYFDYRNHLDVQKLKRDVSLTDAQKQMLEDGNFELFSRDGGGRHAPAKVREWLDKNDYDGWYENEGVGIDPPAGGQPNLAVSRPGKIIDRNTGNVLFSNTKQASPASIFAGLQDLPSVESQVKAPPHLFRPERARAIAQRGMPEARSVDLYHGTTAADKVSNEGFKPSPYGDHGSGIYLTPEPGYADEYARYGSDKDQWTNPDTIFGNAPSYTGNSPGILPVTVTGKFANDAPGYQDDILSAINAGQDVQDKIKDYRAAGYDAVSSGWRAGEGGETVVFPDAKGKGVVRSKTTGNVLFSSAKQASPASIFLAEEYGKTKDARKRRRIIEAINKINFT